MVVVLAGKMPGLREASGESVLRCTLHQVVASHLWVVVRHCRGCRCTVVRARSMGGVVDTALVHCRSVGGGACRRTVACHGAHSQRTEAKRSSRTTWPHAHSDARAAAVHWREPRAGATRVLPKTSPSVREPHLDARLCQARGLGELLPGVDVWVLGPGEGSLQGLQLLGGEGGARASLFALEGNARLRFRVTYVRVASCKEKNGRFLV